jgi:hypothetical protein
MATEFKDIVEATTSSTGKILREKLSCGHWVETAKRGLQVMNLKTKVPITKRTCKDCPPAAQPTKKVVPATKKIVVKPAASKIPSTTVRAPPVQRYREIKESERISCPECEGVVVCWSGCRTQKHGSFKVQDAKQLAKKASIERAARKRAGLLPGPTEPKVVTTHTFLNP